MAKIVYLMGKSSTGKDTIYKELLAQKEIPLKTIVPYTTRPIRALEHEGVEYHFTDETGFQELLQKGKIIEERSYRTFHGVWRYFTVDDGQMEVGGTDFIMIGTLESYGKMKEYYGSDRLLPVLIELDDGIRLERALQRERMQEHPKYEEMCRRFLADSEDFSEEHIEDAKISRRFYNNELSTCIEEILLYIKENCV